MSEVLLSVVVPVHNLAVWVEECLQSILSQNVDSLEVIVVDDHSTDDSFALIAKLANAEPRLKLVAAKSTGGGSARNQGAKLAIGKYLVFADGDDIVPPGAYQALMKSLEQSGSDMAVGSYLKFNATSTISPSRSWGVFNQPKRQIDIEDAPQLIATRAVWNKMFLRSFWVENQIEFPDVARSNDIVPMVKAYTSAKKLDLVNRVVYLYRDRPGASSMTTQARGITGLLSYFNQEKQCHELLLASGKTKTLNAFWNGFLHSDGWVHLHKALNQPLTEAESNELAESVNYFWQQAPADKIGSLPSHKRIAFELSVSGYANLAALAISERLSLPDLLKYCETDLSAPTSLPAIAKSVPKLLVEKAEAAVAGKANPQQVAQVLELIAQIQELVGSTDASLLAQAKARLELSAKYSGDENQAVTAFEATPNKIKLSIKSNLLAAEPNATLWFEHRLTKLRVNLTLGKNRDQAQLLTSKLWLFGNWDLVLRYKTSAVQLELPVANDPNLELVQSRWASVRFNLTKKGKAPKFLSLNKGRAWFLAKSFLKRLA